MGVVRVRGLLDNSTIGSWRMLMPFLGGCMTTPSFWVLMMPWFSWRLRMEIFQFSPCTSLWQVGEQSLSCAVQCGTLGPL